MNRRTYRIFRKTIELIKTVIMLIIIFAFMFAIAYINTHYSREGFAYPTEYKNEYLFRDTTDNEWIFFSKDKIEPHTPIHVKMYNNCTERNIYDDMIIDYTILELN